jgi:methyltransferase-like protein
VDVHSSEDVVFRTVDDAEVTTTDPFAKALLLELHERRPQPVTFDALVAAERRRVHGEPPTDPIAVAEDEKAIGIHVFRCFTGDIVQLRSSVVAFSTVLPEKPCVWPYARRQAAQRAAYVTNLRHEGVSVDEYDRHVIELCDGTRDVPALVDSLLRRVDDGTLRVRKDGGPFADRDELRFEIARALGVSLQVLIRSACVL